MGRDQAVIPAWVAPTAQAVADAHRIAHVTAADTGDIRTAAVAASVNWVTGGQPAPLTERTDPVTRRLVETEWVLAGNVELDTQSGWLFDDIPPADPVTDDRRWAAGAGVALGWLLGVHPRPPVQIPRRLPDGSTPTAEDLYREIVAGRPHASWLPEQRAQARRRATRAAEEYRRLADLADRAR